MDKMVRVIKTLITLAETHFGADGGNRIYETALTEQQYKILKPHEKLILNILRAKWPSAQLNLNPDIFPNSYIFSIFVDIY